MTNKLSILVPAVFYGEIYTKLSKKDLGNSYSINADVPDKNGIKVYSLNFRDEYDCEEAFEIIKALNVLSGIEEKKKN